MVPWWLSFLMDVFAQIINAPIFANETAGTLVYWIGVLVVVHLGISAVKEFA